VSAQTSQDIILPDPADMPAQSASAFRWIWFFVRPYAPTLIFYFIMRILRYAVLFLLPLAIGQTINAFETGWGFTHQKDLLTYAAAYMAVYAVCLFSIRMFFHESAAQDRMMRAMTMFSIRHMNSLPLSWHEAQGSGGKLQRVMTARNCFKGLFDIYKWSLVPFAGGMIAVAISIVFMKAPLWFLAVYGGFAASFCWVAFHTARPLPELHNRHNAVLEKLLAGVYEFVSAVRTVKAFHMEPYIEQKAREHESEGHGAMRRVFRASFHKWSMLNMVGCFWLAVIFGASLSGVYGHWLTIGAFSTLFYLAYDLWKTLEGLVYVQDQFLEYRAGFMRLTETLKAAPRALDLAPVRTLPANWASLRFAHAGFSYGEGKDHALSDISFELRRGEKIALVGPSGAGKSTLVKLLMKQMWPGEGQIAVDGIDLRHIDSGDWLGRIGFVPQDVELFNMSIRENVLLGSDCGEADFRAALEQAAFAGFVDTLPEGADTFIGERGIKLSGGQRQRLGIARALVRQAELIVFDEATSALDSLSEQAIQRAIEDSFAGKTLVVIAHRLSTVRHVDRILVLENGRLAEQGSFNELIARGGTFARMWALQSGHYMKEAV
jgi:ATP-binding cassette subfamily B protein